MDLSTLQEHELIGLLPCPLKVPFESLITSYVEGTQNKNLRYLVKSNANTQFDFFPYLKECQEINQMPDIMIAPGFNYFFHKEFRERFVDKGFFQSVGSQELNPSIDNLPLQDPEGHYNILCFNPTVMLVDRTNHKDIPLPSHWADLFRPEYERSVAIRGHQHSDFCEGVLLNMYKEHGEEGVRKLGRATKIGLHPAEMVKLVGSGKSEAPIISAIPYSFSKLVRSKKDVAVIWPEDGAIVNPMTMMVKSSRQSDVNNLAKFLAEKDVGAFFSDAYFPSYHPLVDNKLPEGSTFKWIGWDFIEENDIASLAQHLEDVFLKAYWEGRQ
ncbi:ABC transporter substrate-binding protein [Niallia sp. 01092]|uniref:ABC transporter substrate-binding protein n=1 Tax=unclassified Niallia TaxID=2837522 RepID=UPI003FD60236